MNSINTLTFSNINIIGKRVCEVCGAKVPIIQTTRNGEIVEISDCLNCENKKIEDEMIAFKEAADKRRVERIFEEYSMVPDELLTATFENYIPQNETMKAAKDKCIWYAEHFGESKDVRNLLLQGSYGLGKSHLSYSIAKYVKSRGKSVIFITTPDLLRAIKNSYGNNRFSESEILKACALVDLLVLDDIGAEYIPKNKDDEDNKESWAGDILLTIINSRLGKHTIYTTNYKSPDLQKKYGFHGGRIISRMMRGTYRIKFEGKDYRIQQAKKVQGYV
jgi:DNA replication protein DnaC